MASVDVSLSELVACDTLTSDGTAATMTLTEHCSGDTRLSDRASDAPIPSAGRPYGSGAYGSGSYS